MLYGMASAGTVAWVMYQKFCNGLPYYRQEKRLETVWRGDHQSYYGKLGDPKILKHFFFLCMNTSTGKLLERGFAMADETPLQVLHEPERRAQTKLWLFRSGEDGGPSIILYKYSESGRG